ncbi:MAG: hypothetical protein ABFQ95_05390, partial [Pseudomonadota bacterium]
RKNTPQLELFTTSENSPHSRPLWGAITLCYNEKIYTFFRKWACKEAYLKAHGIGWLANGEITNESNQGNIIESNKYNSNASHHYPHLVDWIPNYVSALFVLGSILKPVYRVCDQRSFYNFQYTSFKAL